MENSYLEKSQLLDILNECKNVGGACFRCTKFAQNLCRGTNYLVEQTIRHLQEKPEVLQDGDVVNPVNVYGETMHCRFGSLEGVYGGFGFRNPDTGIITWYDGYNPKDGPEGSYDSFTSIVVPYGNGCPLEELKHPRKE